MSYEITSESYGRRLPKITATATSTDDLATLGTDWAEGSTCTISDTTYKLDKVKGWVDPSSGGGGGASAFTVTFTPTDEKWTTFTADKTIAEIEAAYEEGAIIQGRFGTEDGGYTMLNLETVHGGLASFEAIMISGSPPSMSNMKLGVYSGGVNCFIYDFELTPAT